MPSLEPFASSLQGRRTTMELSGYSGSIFRPTWRFSSQRRSKVPQGVADVQTFSATAHRLLRCAMRQDGRRPPWSCQCATVSFGDPEFNMPETQSVSALGAGLGHGCGRDSLGFCFRRTPRSLGLIDGLLIPMSRPTPRMKAPPSLLSRSGPSVPGGCRSDRRSTARGR